MQKSDALLVNTSDNAMGLWTVPLSAQQWSELVMGKLLLVSKIVLLAMYLVL